MLVDEEPEGKIVMPEKWDDMTIPELIEQKNILLDRIETAVAMHSKFGDTLYDGIKKIDIIISTKLGDKLYGIF